MHSLCPRPPSQILRLHASLLALLFGCLAQSGQAASEVGLVEEVASGPPSVTRMAARPLRFELNTGQAQPDVKFVARGPGYAVFLTPTEAILSVQHLPEQGTVTNQASVTPSRSPKARRLRHPPAYAQSPLSIRLFNARPDPALEGLDPQSGPANYFIGSDPARWRREVPSFARVKYHHVYPGIDLVYYGNQRELEYDFIIQPGADPRSIVLEFAGARSLILENDGSLLARLAGTTVRWKKPAAYQDIDGRRIEVGSAYELRGPGMVSFRLDAYDTGRALVIDPTLAYSTYLGGSAFDLGKAIAVDGAGNVYVAGQTISLNFPVTNAYRATPVGASDAFVTKLNSNGTALIYSTYLGGTGNDFAFGIAVDASGNAYVTGSTDSDNFPTRNAAQSSLGGNNTAPDAFITKLGPAGTNILYSSYLGGRDFEEGYGIAVGTGGNAYVTGVTESEADFPKKAPLLQASGTNGDAFVARFITTNSGASSLVYASWLGGADYEQGKGIAVDGSGNAFVIGEVQAEDFVTANFPVNNGFQMVYGGGPSDAFITKISSNGATRIFSTYLGGMEADSGNAIALDSSTNIYVTGETYSTDFPIVNAFQPNHGSGGFFSLSDAFVARISRVGNSLLYSTFLGGQLNDSGTGIAVGGDNVVHVTGETTSGNFPVANRPAQSNYGGDPDDAFIAMFNVATIGLPSLLYSTFLGGSSHDVASGIAVDTNGNFYVTGQTSSTNNFPRTSGVFQPMFKGGYSDSFVLKFAQSSILSILRATNRTTLTWPISPTGFSLQRNPGLATAGWTAVTNSPVISNSLNRVTLTNVTGSEFYRLRKP